MVGFVLSGEKEKGPHSRRSRGHSLAVNIYLAVFTFVGFPPAISNETTQDRITL